MNRWRTCILIVLAGMFLIGGDAASGQMDLPSIEVMHNGKNVTITTVDAQVISKAIRDYLDRHTNSLTDNAARSFWNNWAPSLAASFLWRDDQSRPRLGGWKFQQIAGSDSDRDEVAGADDWMLQFPAFVNPESMGLFNATIERKVQ